MFTFGKALEIYGRFSQMEYNVIPYFCRKNKGK